MRRKIFLASSSLAALTCAMMASAQSSTETYSYDALGRLVRVVTNGGQNNNETQSICYDPAGNRTVYASNVSAGATGCDTPSPTPTPTASFAVSDAQGLEGTNLVFTVTRTGGTGATHTVSFATAPGTAATNDYVGTSGTLTFGPSQTTATINVTARTDTRVEGNEIFYVNLSSPSAGASISDGQGAGTIFNDDGNCTTCRSSG